MHQSFVAIHINGIYIINLDFCACTDFPSACKQLLEVGWWPSTPLEPQSTALMTILQSFYTWNLQGQIFLTDFYYGLKQITCDDGLSSVPVSIYLSVGQEHHDNANECQGLLGPVDADGA